MCVHDVHKRRVSGMFDVVARVFIVVAADVDADAGMGYDTDVCMCCMLIGSEASSIIYDRFGVCI